MPRIIPNFIAGFLVIFLLMNAIPFVSAESGCNISVSPATLDTLYYLKGQDVNISVSVSDCRGSPLENATVYIKLYTNLSAYECTPKEVSEGYYTCKFMSRVWPYGWTSLDIAARKGGYNPAEYKKKDAFFLGSRPFLYLESFYRPNWSCRKLCDFRAALTDPDTDMNRVELWISRDKVSWRRMAAINERPIYSSYGIKFDGVPIPGEYDGLVYFRIAATDEHNFSYESETYNFTFYFCDEGPCIRNITVPGSIENNSSYCGDNVCESPNETYSNCCTDCQCPSGQECNGEECVQKPAITPPQNPDICTPEARRCSGKVIESCSTDGTAWQVYESCGNGCGNNPPECIIPPAAGTPNITWYMGVIALMAASIVLLIIYLQKTKKR